MAKKSNVPTRTKLEEVNDSLSTMAQRLETNKKYIYWVAGAIAVIVLLALAYIYGIRNPRIQKAKDEIGAADIALIQGDTAKALTGYEKVFDAYSNSTANRAAFNAAILLYQQGKYDKAASYLEKYDPDGVLVGPASQSLLGDCYVNLKKLDQALAAFDKAIKLSGDNADYTPFFMMKKATIFRSQKKFAEEAEIYQTIHDKYPTQDVTKYLERAKAQAGK